MSVEPWSTRIVKVQLRPPTDVAGICIGSTHAEAREQCSRLGRPEDFRRGGDEPVSLAVRRPGGLSIFVYFDSDDRVEAIEVGRPDGGDDVVLFRDMDVFKTSAEDLIERLTAEEVVNVEEQGRSATVVGLLLALWRPVVPETTDDPEGRYFEAALVAKPDYYD
jgi:hypothetical protein